MSDAPLGQGWWQAQDDRWYPPEQHPEYRPPLPQAPPPPTYQVPVAAPQPASYPVPYDYSGMVVPQTPCFACGGMVLSTSSVCPRCGTMRGNPKDKTVAVLLAVFLAPWNWCYTYKRDAAKFWVGLGLYVLGVFLAVVLIGFFMLFGVWLWAVIDAATKPDAYYRQFPYGPG